MNKESAKGLGATAAGSLKEAIGKVTGDTELEAEGSAQKAAGNAENAVTGVKGAVRGAVKR